MAGVLTCPPPAGLRMLRAAAGAGPRLLAGAAAHGVLEPGGAGAAGHAARAARGALRGQRDRWARGGWADPGGRLGGHGDAPRGGLEGYLGDHQVLGGGFGEMRGVLEWSWGALGE